MISKDLSQHEAAEQASRHFLTANPDRSWQSFTRGFLGMPNPHANQGQREDYAYGRSAFRSWRASSTCTGVAASWCPIHGQCRCPPQGYKNHPMCPLHSPTQSAHADDGYGLVEA